MLNKQFAERQGFVEALSKQPYYAFIIKAVASPVMTACLTLVEFWVAKTGL